MHEEEPGKYSFRFKEKKYEEEWKLGEENFSSNPEQKERHLKWLSRKYPEINRKLSQREEKFLAALEKIQKGEISITDEKDSAANGGKKEDIEKLIARLKKRYQCSSGQYLAELACGNIASIGSMVIGGGGTAVVKEVIYKNIRRKTRREETKRAEAAGQRRATEARQRRLERERAEAEQRRVEREKQEEELKERLRREIKLKKKFEYDEDPYELLSIPRHSSPEQIKKGFPTKSNEMASGS